MTRFLSGIDPDKAKIGFAFATISGNLLFQAYAYSLGT